MLNQHILEESKHIVYAGLVVASTMRIFNVFTDMVYSKEQLKQFGILLLLMSLHLFSLHKSKKTLDHTVFFHVQPWGTIQKIPI